MKKVAYVPVQASYLTKDLYEAVGQRAPHFSTRLEDKSLQISPCPPSWSLSIPPRKRKVRNSEVSNDEHRRETDVIPRRTKKGGPGNLETQASIPELKDRGHQEKLLEIKGIDRLSDKIDRMKNWFERVFLYNFTARGKTKPEGHSNQEILIKKKERQTSHEETKKFTRKEIKLQYAEL